jgi:transposase
MRYYAGVDLHSTNHYLAIQDETGRVVARQRLPNEAGATQRALAPFAGELAGVAVESTYNWYWLVDALMASGYRVHLANPSAMQQYAELKHRDDDSDAVWLSELLRLGILPEGYIYPAAQRPVRDLRRRRLRLVQQRTALIHALQGVLERNTGRRLSAADIKAVCADRVQPLLPAGAEDLRCQGQALKACIDFFGLQIRSLEAQIGARMAGRDDTARLQQIPGIGRILALTLVLESGPMSRFPRVGNYASYCRRVPSRWRSNDKPKGRGNRKNGNPYLAWAYGEASMMLRRYCPAAQRFYQRKAARSHPCVAHAALAHKLSRAVFYMLRDGVAFDPTKLFR